jgi:hypothetical protein
MVKYHKGHKDCRIIVSKLLDICQISPPKPGRTRLKGDFSMKVKTAEDYILDLPGYKVEAASQEILESKVQS